MTIKSVLVALVVSASLGAPASALTVSTIDGYWTSSVTESGTPVSGEGTDQIRWGTSIGEGQSGYDFNATPTTFDVQTDTQFVLGTFTHLNFPVTGTALQTVDLAVSFTISGYSTAFTSVFSFSHNETNNYWDRYQNPIPTATCADGGQNATGLNVNGCADLVTATSNTNSSDTFIVNGVTYVMDILGFQYGGGLLTDFWTVERQSNTADLLAVFRAVDTPPEVPLPASGLLLLGGLGVLFARRRPG